MEVMKKSMVCMLKNHIESQKMEEKDVQKQGRTILLNKQSEKDVWIYMKKKHATSSL